jgi:hypothetical protein
MVKWGMIKIEESIRTIYVLIEKGGYIMAMKKEKTAKKTEPVAKDFMDFVRDAYKKRSTLGKDFFDLLKKEDVKAADLSKFLKGWHYDTKPADIKMLLEIYTGSKKLRDGVTESGY